MESPKVLGYVRVSSKKQAASGLSIEVQKDKVRAFAELHNLPLTDVVEDGGRSAESLDRPGIQQVLHRLDVGEASGLVVAKFDRLTRIVRDWASLVDERFGADGGPTLYSASESLDLRTPNGRFFGNLICSFSQCELETGVERTESVMGAKKSRGELLGNVPYGFMVAADGKTLVGCPIEANALAFMIGLKTKGLKLKEIVKELDDFGYYPRSGGKWALSTVSQLLREVPCGPPL